MPHVKYATASGPLQLGTKLGSGGEGAVYETQYPQLVAKVYASAPAQAQLDKLQVMTTMADAELLRYCAWPKEIISANGRSIGFTMPRLDAKHQILELFGPKRRQALFPDANWQYLVHASVNLATGFEALHNRQIVVGDVNSQKIVVEKGAIMHFLDCDSFQLSHGGRLFLCAVGVPEYQPKEIQSLGDLSKVPRTPQQDAFGLATMIFQLLFVGKHPFAGVLPASITDGSIPANIAAGRYFYGQSATQKGLRPPPGSVNLGLVTPDIAALFDRAFLGAPAGRPSAVEWKTALEAMEHKVVRCSVNPAHKSLSHACVWCALEGSSGIRYFVVPLPADGAKGIDDSIWQTFTSGDIEKLWAAIRAVPVPPAESPNILKTQTPRSTELPSDLRSKAIRWAVIVAVLGSAFVAVDFALGSGYLWWGIPLWFVLVALRPNASLEYHSRTERLARAEADFKDAADRWRAAATSTRFTDTTTRLLGIRTMLLNQRTAYDAELAKLEREREVHERQEFLDSFPVAKKKIHNLGPKRRAILLSFGIETAGDIDQQALWRIPRLPYQVQSALLAWRRELEGRFRFDPKKGLAPKVLREFKGRFAQQRLEGKRDLERGPNVLAAIAADIVNSRPSLKATAVVRANEVAQARADLRPLGFWFKKK